MKTKTMSQISRVALPLISIAFSLVSAYAQTEKILYSFTGLTGGTGPTANLTFDAAGNLYGTTAFGIGSTEDCASSCGTVFQLTPGSTGVWQEHDLYTFTGGSDGQFPTSGVVFDSSGQLYGTTEWGGGLFCLPSNHGCGTAFRLTPAADGTWTETLLQVFGGGRTTGILPTGNILLDGAGNLYGTTFYGESVRFYGAAYELSPTSSGLWTETLLHNFTLGPGGGGTMSGLIFGPGGNLYGTAEAGGGNFSGAIFELSNNGGQWTNTTLYSFSGQGDGFGPTGSLITDAAGNFYGTAYFGGLVQGSHCRPVGCGVVFKLSPKAGGGWQQHVLFTFTGSTDGAYPRAGLVRDPAGNLYGTTLGGGNSGCYKSPTGCGVVFKLSPTATGWHETVLHAFAGKSDGALPYASLILDAAGNLYGTTAGGGVTTGVSTTCQVNGCGTVFEIMR